MVEVNLIYICLCLSPEMTIYARDKGCFEAETPAEEVDGGNGGKKDGTCCAFKDLTALQKSFGITDIS